MITLSKNCPLCGRDFEKGEPVKTALLPQSWGAVGLSFHERCWNERQGEVAGILEEAVRRAQDVLAGQNQPFDCAQNRPACAGPYADRASGGTLRVESVRTDIPLEMAIAVVGCLLLALRHPENTGPSAALAREFARGVAGGILTSNLVALPSEVRREWARELGIDATGATA
jgi:hypothetical protein